MGVIQDGFVEKSRFAFSRREPIRRFPGPCIRRSPGGQERHVLVIVGFPEVPFHEGS
jgi:hypothetical protein